MRSLLLAIPALLGMGFVSSELQAFDCCMPICAPQIVWVDKVVTCYQPVLRAKTVEVPFNRIVPREVVSQVPVTRMVPEIQNVPKTILVCKMVPQEVDRLVVGCRMIPVTCVDPCTGCTYVSCRPETFTTKVRTCIMQPVYEKQQIIVPVCTYKLVTEVVQCRKIVCDVVPDKKICTVHYCEMQAYTKTVKVPVCVPCGAAESRSKAASTSAPTLYGD